MAIQTQLINEQNNILKIQIQEEGVEWFFPRPCQHICTVTYIDRKSSAFLLDTNQIVPLLHEIAESKIECSNRQHFRYVGFYPSEQTNWISYLAEPVIATVGTGMKGVLWLRYYTGLSK